MPLLLSSSRRAVLLATAALIVPLLAGCSSDTPPPENYPPLSFDYLGKLRLLVASIDIDDAATKTDTANTEHVEDLAPVRPVDALRRMAEQRLVAAGTGGRAVFVIEDASIVRAADGFAGKMAVRLEVSSGDGTRSGLAEARVSRTYYTPDITDAGTRAALYQLVKLMMDDMNVELEYRVKQKMRDFLETADGAAAPVPVQSQDLNTAPPPPPPSPGPSPSPSPSGPTPLAPP